MLANSYVFFNEFLNDGKGNPDAKLREMSMHN